MQKRDDHHAANGLRLGVLLPSLIVLALCLFALKEILKRPAETPVENQTTALTRPAPKPFQDEKKVEVAELTKTNDLHFSESVPAVKKTEAPKNVSTIPVTKPAAVVSPKSLVVKQPMPENSHIAIEASPRHKIWGIFGKVTLIGKPPENPIIDLRRDPNCGKLYSENPRQLFFVVSDDGALADVVVSLKGNLPSKRAPSERPLLIDQKACMYFPYISALFAGQKIQVRNSDTFLHNVHPSPTQAGNKEKNVAQFPNKVDEFVFDKPEMFLRFKCDVHPWMFAYVSVFDHPYFAVTDMNGFFHIRELPLGHYTVEATHRKAGTVTKEIDIKRHDESFEMNFEFNTGEQRGFSQQQAKATP